MALGFFSGAAEGLQDATAALQKNQRTAFSLEELKVRREDMAQRLQIARGEKIAKQHTRALNDFEKSLEMLTEVAGTAQAPALIRSARQVAVRVNLTAPKDGQDLSGELETRLQAAIDAEPSADRLTREKTEETTATLGATETALGRPLSDSERARKLGLAEQFSSPVGKLIDDRRRMVETFGADSREVEILSAAIEAEQSGAPDFSDSFGMFKEYSRQSSNSVAAAEGFAKVRSAANLDSGPGDIALIFGYMKVLDPRSVVRESEFATAENAAGVPERVRNLFNRALSGERLGPLQRAELVEAAASQFLAVIETQVARDDVFRQLATDLRLDPNIVVKSPITPEVIAETRRLVQAAARPANTGLTAEDTATLAKDIESITTEEARKLSPFGKATLRARIEEAQQ